MHKAHRSLLALFLSCLTFSVTATDPVIINFEQLARGEIVRDQFADQGVLINAVNWSHGPDIAVAFDTTNIGNSDDEDLEAPFNATAGFEAHGELRPGKVLVLHERNDCDGNECDEPDDESSRPAGWLEFRFAVPVTLHGMKLIDINYEDDETPSQLVLYGADGEVLATLDAPAVNGQGRWRPWQVERTDVMRARLYLPGDGAIDDLAFTPQSNINWSPEFRSDPPVAVAPDAVYRYAPVTYDQNGDPVEIELLSSPPGMSIAGDGTITWTPGGQVGTFPIELEAKDSQGAVAHQAFTLHVGDQILRTQSFEFETGTILDDELIADGLRISGRNLGNGSDHIVTFDTGAPTGGDSDLAAPFEEGSENELGLGDREPGKVLILQETHDCDVQDLICAEPDDESSRPAGWIDFDFSQPAHIWSLEVFDITSDDPAARKIELLDADGEPLGVNATIPRTGANDWDRLVINATGVRRMRVHLDGDGAFDNLRYALVGDAEPDNLPPVINDEEFVILADTALDVAAPGVLANDHDPDGDTISAVLDDAPWHGSVILNPDGSFIYTPPPGFTGKDEFEYRVHDGEAASIAEDVEIYVVGSQPEPEPEPEPEPAPIIQFFTATPSSIALGQQALLSWSVINATTVMIEPGNTPVPNNGSLAVSPTQTTQYRITASNTTGDSASRTRVIEVVPPLLIAIDIPAENAYARGPRPYFHISVISGNGTVDPSTLELFEDGQPLSANCDYTLTQHFGCLAVDPFPEGPATITARVANYNGASSNLATRMFIVDSTPPGAPDSSKITVSPPDQELHAVVSGQPGTAEPGAMLWIRTIFSSYATEVIADGSFTTTITARAGRILTIDVRDAAGNISPSIEMIVPSAFPLPAIVSPPEGALLASNVPEIVIDYIETGAGIDLESLVISANAENIEVNCTHESASSRCIPVNPLPDGDATISVSVSDISDIPSPPVSVTFHIDTVPPVLIRDKVTLVQQPENLVRITGAPGAAEPYTNVILDTGNTQTNVPASMNGSFETTLVAGTGEQIHVHTRDAAGNTSPIETLSVPPPPLTVTIDSPANGSHVAADRITVRGHHNGGLNSGVSVNGARAITASDGSFVAVDVPLLQGSNEIKAIATAFAGETGETTISVTSEGIPPFALIIPTQADGPAPLEVKFRVEYHGDPNILHHFEIDFDGDDVSDQVFTNVDAEPLHLYMHPGQYEPRLLVFTESEVLEATTVIRVASDTEMDAMFRGMWSDWRDRLIAGDTEAALAYISPVKREQYRKLFEGLSGRWPQIFQTFTGMEPAVLSSGFSEYAVNRIIDGENRLFLVYFAQDENGVWRLHSF